MLIYQPVATDMRQSSVAGNAAMGGGGGGIVVRGGELLSLTKFDQVEFVANEAGLDGGAVRIDSALGPCKAVLNHCVFIGNTAKQNGGSVAASGPAEFACSSCNVQNSTAKTSGGWLSCTGCASVTVTGSGRSRNCGAAMAGGVIYCERCGSVHLADLTMTENSAGSGGAVAVQDSQDVAIDGCEFEQNAAGQQPLLQQQQLSSRHSSRSLLAYALTDDVSLWPGLWQQMYQTSWVASGSDCSSSDGLGGALCLATAGGATVSNSAYKSNTAARGGAVAASAACSAGSSSNSSACVVQLADVTAVGNAARDAAGFLYTSTPQAVQLAGSGSSSASTHQQQQALLEQLQQDNSVAEGGYGPGVASAPTNLSFIGPMQSTWQDHSLDRQVDSVDSFAVTSPSASNSLPRRRLLQAVDDIDDDCSQQQLCASMRLRNKLRGVGRMLLPLLGSARSKGAAEADGEQAWVASQVEQELGVQGAAAAAGEQNLLSLRSISMVKCLCSELGNRWISRCAEHRHAVVKRLLTTVDRR
jgi:hypothetical protein